MPWYNTIILWDIDDCKIPAGLNAVLVSRNITNALRKKGYHSSFEITGYGDMFQTGNDFSGAVIWTMHCDPGNRDARRNMILADFLIHASGYDHPVNLVLILGDISRHSGFLRALRYLKSKKSYNLLLAQPEAASEELLGIVSCAWLWSRLWSRLSAGKAPIPRMRGGRLLYQCKDTVWEEGYVRAKTAVFWDMEDCRIPDGLDVGEVSLNIRSALADQGYDDGVVSIYAYRDMNQIHGLESTGIVPRYFPAGGDRVARLERILVDFLCCAVDDPDIRNLMLIVGDVSGHTEFILAVNLLNLRNYNCLLAQPQNAAGLTIDDVKVKWLWESLSAGVKPLASEIKKLTSHPRPLG